MSERGYDSQIKFFRIDVRWPDVNAKSGLDGVRFDDLDQMLHLRATNFELRYDGMTGI
jgi:hypothetical protein